MRRLGSKEKQFIDGEVGYSVHSVDTDKLDIHFFEEVKENNPVIEATLREAQKDYEPFGDLQQDIFSSLYRYKPHRLQEHKIKTSHLLNYHVMGDVMESPKYKELRAHTRLDDINATLGTEVLGDEAHELIKQLKEQMEKLKELMDAEGEAGEEGEGEGEGEGQGDGNGPGQNGEKMTMSEAQKRLEEAKKAFKESMKKKEVKQKINRMLDKTQQQLTETSDMIQNWGLGGDDTFTSMPYHEKMELLKKLRDSQKLKKIAELAGRFKRIATNRQREKVKKGTDEIYDLSLGRELNRIIPAELMKLRHPSTKKQFYKDFAEGKLLQYELRGKEKKQKGAIVVAIDDSGSMSGDPEIYKKIA